MVQECVAVLVIAVAAGCHAQCVTWTFTPEPRRSTDFFGPLSVIDGGVALVLDADCSPRMQHIHSYSKSGWRWRAGEAISNPDGEECASFGSAMSLVGTTLVVGARGSSIDEFQCGRCYVFLRDGDEWSHAQTLVNPSVEYNATFGHAIAFEGDTLAISATSAGGGAVGGGRVDLFYRDARSGLWLLEQSIDAPDTPGGGAFGYHLRFVQGDLFILHPALGNGDAIHVYRKTRGAWRSVGRIDAMPGVGGEQWGWSIAARSQRLAVGVPQSPPPGLPASGMVQIFDRSGDEWTPSALVVPVNPSGGQIFGASVALSTDGTTLLVGAPNDSAGGSLAGSVSVYREIDGAWVFEKKVFGEPPVPGAQLGWDIAYDPIADIAIIGRGSTNEAFVYEGIAPLDPQDCNGNGESDVCDIASGVSQDENVNGVPDECEPSLEPADLNGDGSVDGQYLALLLGAWGSGGGCGVGCDGDLTEDGVVDAADVNVLIAAWT